MGNPIDDFLAYADDVSLEKTAEPGRFAGLGIHGGNALAQGLGAGIGASLLAGGALAAQHIYNAATAKRDLIKLFTFFIHAQNTNVANMVMTTRIHATRDIQV